MTQAPAHAPNGPQSRGSPDVQTPDPAQQPDTTPPSWLTEDAHAAWDAAVALLTQVRIVAKSDLTALARYCQLLTEWIELTERIGADGSLMEDRFGQLKPHPGIQARGEIERAIRSLEKALGLDPASYMDLTKDIDKRLTGKQKAGSGRRVGGFLNKKP